MEIDQGALFTFLGLAVTGLLGYMTVRIQQVHKLANSNLSKQTDLVADANKKIEALTEKVMDLLEKSAPSQAATPAPVPVVVENRDPLPVTIKKP